MSTCSVYHTGILYQCIYKFKRYEIYHDKSSFIINATTRCIVKILNANIKNLSSDIIDYRLKTIIIYFQVAAWFSIFVVAVLHSNTFENRRYCKSMLLHHVGMYLYNTSSKSYSYLYCFIIVLLHLCTHYCSFGHNFIKS